MVDFFVSVWNWILGFFSTYNWFADTVDILLVALIIYYAIRMIRDSRAEQLIKGILLLLVAYLISSLFNFVTVKYLLQLLFDNGLLALVIIFQPELRRILEKAANSRSGLPSIVGIFTGEQQERQVQQLSQAISAVSVATKSLQQMKMGALIVFERNTRLGDIVNTGTVVDAQASDSLIVNLFFNKAPLHDGAVIIRDGKVFSAGCILPLSDNQNISRELGTRHRAGVGMSENSDAVVVIVSEETGAISVAVEGRLERDFTPESLRVKLSNELMPATEKTDTEKRGIAKIWGKVKK
jgi:diadenylate cyclase